MSQFSREKILYLLQPSDNYQWFEQLQLMGIETVLPTLMEVVSDRQMSDVVRGRAAIALGHLQDNRATEALLTALDSGDPVLKARIAEALGRIGTPTPTVLQRLITCLDDEDAYVRRSAADTLGLMQAVEALPSLKAMAAKDNTDINRQIALSVIAKLEQNNG